MSGLFFKRRLDTDAAEMERLQLQDLMERVVKKMKLTCHLVADSLPSAAVRMV